MTDGNIIPKDIRKIEDVSSAGITATLRCVHPDISRDTLSVNLASADDQAKAHAFMDTYNYPLAALKISLCARYMLDEVQKLLHTKEYDSVISFASGLSLLVYNIIDNADVDGIKFFDTDLEFMINARVDRINSLPDGLLDSDILNKITTLVFDLEKAYENGQKLKDVFPGCNKPIFILDGVSYFLTPGCVSWLASEMSSYEDSAVVMYYWPDDMFEISELFRRVFPDLNKGMILEAFESVGSADTLGKIKAKFSNVEDYSLAEVEAMFVKDSKEHQLLNANEYFPVRVLTALMQS